MLIVSLALKSLASRWLTAMLTVLAIAFSIVLLLGVQRIADGARAGFQSTLSGTHLIVGARSGPVQLLLHTVFRIGAPTSPIAYATYEQFAAHPDVAWSIPLALGDSHRGFPVVGTNTRYFEHYRFGRDLALAFAVGGPFEDAFDAVLGAGVAAALGYRVGDELTLAHGMAATSFLQHDDRPFRVRGILEPTGTPVDRAVHITLEGVESLHVGWEDGAPPAFAQRPSTSLPDAHPAAPRKITAFLVGLRSPVGIFRLQRAVNTYRGEPLSAILPGATLVEVWKIVEIANGALEGIAAFVVLAGLMGMLATILASLEQRRREMAVLRAVGARPGHVFGLLVAEAGLLAAGGCAVGVVALAIAAVGVSPSIEARFGLVLELGALTLRDLATLGAVVVCAMLVGTIAGWRAYARSLADGLAPRV